MRLPNIRAGVLVAGDVMEDIIVVPEGAMVHGSDVRAKIEILPGGSGANQSVWLGTFGAPVRFLARVGAADLASYEGLFTQYGVRPTLVGDDDLQTGRLVTLVDSDGERSFFTDRAANTRLSVADIPSDIFDDIGLVHLSGYAFFEPGPRAVALHLMATARKKDIPVSIDPASTGFLAEVGVAQFLEWTHGAAFLFPNRAEAALLSGTDDVAQQMRFLGEHYRVVVIKQGADGATIGGRDGIVKHVPAPQIDAVDTSGAGDAFFAGFIAALRENAAVKNCLERGNAAGAKAALRLGGQPA